MPPALPTAEQLSGLDLKDHITLDYHRELKRLARASLFFFAKYIFGCSGLNDRAHLSLCNAAQRVIVTPHAFGVFEDPRATGKSHAITIPGPAWCLVQDTKDLVRRDLLPHGPGGNYLVISYKTPFAAIFTTDTRRRMEQMDLFRWLFGDLLPDFASKGTTWSKEMFTVVRPPGASGISVMALGTEGGSTSLHPLTAFIDDLINEKNYKSPTEVASQVEWVEHSKNLTDIARGSRVLTENAWTERDVNFALREKNKAEPRSVFFFSRSRVVCDVCAPGRELDKFGNPIACDHPLPQRPILDHHLREPDRPYTMADIEELKRTLTRTIWYAQHDNNPLAKAELRWREEWLRWYTLTDADVERGMCAVLISGTGGVSGGEGRVDPGRLVYVPIRDMYVSVALDPGLHRPGLVAAGRAFVPHYGDMAFILDARGEEMTPRDQFFMLFDWVLKWGAQVMAFENVGLQGYIRQTIPTMAEAYERERGRTLPFWVKRPNPDAKRIIGVQVYKAEGDKCSRTDAAISPLAEQRLIACRRDLSPFIDEYTIFDKGKHLDVLEAFVMCVKTWRLVRPMSGEERFTIGAQAAIQRQEFEDAAVGTVGYGEGV